jgi:cation-transporting ATPase E
VAERLRRGEVNAVKEQTSRTVADILRVNVFTRFNALLGGIFIVILLLSGKQDALFGLILIANTAIGVIQELRAKRTLDRLKVIGCSPSPRRARWRNQGRHGGSDRP